MDIYIKIILSSHIINDIDSELNNSEKNIFGIGSKDIIIFTPRIKYY